MLCLLGLQIKRPLHHPRPRQQQHSQNPVDWDGSFCGDCKEQLREAMQQLREAMQQLRKSMLELRKALLELMLGWNLAGKWSTCRYTVWIYFAQLVQNNLPNIARDRTTIIDCDQWTRKLRDFWMCDLAEIYVNPLLVLDWLINSSRSVKQLLFLFLALRYNRNGRSRIRIGMLKDRPKCLCSRRTCFKHLAKKSEDVVSFLNMFWTCSKKEQDDFARCWDFCWMLKHVVGTMWAL